MKRTALPFALLALPLLAFAIGPVASLLWGASVPLGSPDVQSSIYGTIITSAGAALISFLFAFPLAILLERTDLPGRTFFRTLFTLPSAVPPFIFGMGWLVLANPRAGLLNHFLGTGALDIYGPTGIAWVLGGAGLPLVFLPASAQLKRVDASLEEAARISGAGPLLALAAVSGILALPAALSGAALVFLFSASAFGVPYLLGVTASPPTFTLTTRIYSQVLMGPSGFTQASGLALILLVVATVVLLFSRAMGKLGRVKLATGKGLKTTPLPLGAWRTPLAILVALTGLVLVVLPLFAVFLASVQPTFGSFDGITFKHWGAVLSNQRTLAASGTSFALAGATAVLVCTLGLAYAFARQKLGGPLRTLEVTSTWPYAVPGTVLALALLTGYSRDVRLIAFEQVAFVLALGNTVWLLMIAWTAKHLAFGVRNASEGLAQVDVSLGEAARLSGAGPVRAFFDATLPQLKAPILAAFTLTFLTCVTEMTIAVLLVPTGQDVLGTLLFELMSYADPGAAAVLACAFILLVALMLSLQSALNRPREAR